MLKFRLPYDKSCYTDGKFSYRAGDLFFQLWAPETSGETRLVSVPDKRGNFEKTEYELTPYEQALMAFNTRTRLQPMELAEMTPDIRAAHAAGLPASYDLYAEQEILRRYAEQHPETATDLLRRIETVLGHSLTQKYKWKHQGK